MLSIRFDTTRKWWVAGRFFDRLVTSALARGIMPADLSDWQHVADANGGLSLNILEPEKAAKFTAALRETAEVEIAAMGDLNASSPENAAYKESLLRLISVVGSTPNGS